MKMTNWFCKNCKFTGHDCGPWDDKDDYFINVRRAHKDHQGFKIGEPEPINKLTEIEQIFTDYFNDHIDEWFHILVADLKGPDKVCLLKNKPKIVNYK